ncbi:MAG: hypothetical protein ACOYJZ_02320 [Acutalibacter sp.]|jgi:putative ABC transport system permease protein
MKDFINLKDLSNGKTASVPEDGLLVSRKATETLGLKAGSKVEIMDDAGNGVECEIVGVIEHYLPYHLVVTTRSYWESVMGEADNFSVFLLNGDVTGVKEQVQDLPGFIWTKVPCSTPLKPLGIGGLL